MAGIFDQANALPRPTGTAADVTTRSATDAVYQRWPDLRPVVPLADHRPVVNGRLRPLLMEEWTWADYAADFVWGP